MAWNHGYFFELSKHLQISVLSLSYYPFLRKKITREKCECIIAQTLTFGFHSLKVEAAFFMQPASWRGQLEKECLRQYLYWFFRTQLDVPGSFNNLEEDIS